MLGMLIPFVLSAGIQTVNGQEDTEEKPVVEQPAEEKSETPEVQPKVISEKKNEEALPDFKPSEEISEDSAVSLPVNI